MVDAKFGKDLESFGRLVFYNCRSLERITIPLRNGLFAEDDILKRCKNLKSVDLIEGEVLRETIAALLLEEWRNDMDETLDSINRILPTAPAGDLFDEGGKARTIREWIASVLHKFIHYKAQHRHLLDVAATSLKLTLPKDIVTNNVLPFLELPSHMFDGEEDFEEDSSNTSDDNVSSNMSDEGDDNNDDVSQNASFDGGGNHEAEEDEDDDGRKRRKMSNDDE